MSAAPNLSLVLLAYNEEQSLGPVLDDTLAYLDTRPGQHELIVVDDGSSDGTLAVARVAEARDARVRVVVHERNRGMGAGMRSGFGAARGDHVVMLPADGQVRAWEIDKLLPGLAQADIVLSIYGDDRASRGLWRVTLSRGLRLLMRALIHVSFELEGIYLFPVRALREIGLDSVRAETFFFSFELITLAIERGYTATTVVVRLHDRLAGRSKVANLRQIRRVADELLRFARRRRQG
jgi:glycosyltransferase involved in cell wall biosynthesis